jgi:putative PIN family toxin of toxin-antitoxin system
MPTDSNNAARNWTLNPLGAIVLDTNIVLDLFVFSDPATESLRQALESGQVRWIATAAMRDELARVLAYPKIVPRLAHYQLTPEQVLAQFDCRVRLMPVAAKALATCRDADDQKFIDLAVAHQATLLSKDRAVLCMKKRLLALGVRALASQPSRLGE